MDEKKKHGPRDAWRSCRRDGDGDDDLVKGGQGRSGEDTIGAAMTLASLAAVALCLGIALIARGCFGGGP